MSWRLLHPEDLGWGYIENSMPCTGFSVQLFPLLWFSWELRKAQTRASNPESEDCELASESIYTLGADIFNSRYFSSAELILNLLQNKGILDAKGRIQVFPRRFRAIFEFSNWIGSRCRHYQETTWLAACPDIFFQSIQVPFQKNMLLAAQHWTASLPFSCAAPEVL